MKRCPCAVAAVVVMLSGYLWADAKSTAQTNTGPLSAMAWFVGGTWTSDIKDPSDGSVTKVEERIRWSPNHQAIMFNVNFDGKPHYDGFYAYNPATNKIDFYYTSSDGELTIGTVTSDPDGKTFHQEFDIIHANGTTGHLRSTLVRDGENAYEFSVLMQKNGDWQPVFHIRYERKAE